jgi:uncharacterized oligopeptide transporter (OPT) family protein
MAQLWAQILGEVNHAQLVRQVMRLFTVVFERLPMVWILLGLLFNAAGLLLGFEFSLAFGYMMVGWVCIAYGVAVFVLRLSERPQQSAATRLSPKFISAGATVIMPVPPEDQAEQAKEQAESEQSA